ncbi:MAG TPA: DEAD/DEAH box helicase [Defluviitoga tunisiensis]|jgi:ATP-dependent RNA helicase DeaD|nr:DEAD/DEAH box helicase [Defluviitoga tunisiensis]HOP25101.1 DEAD/DEAH box helicase [Defluviitoga sp.]MDY0379717.1 DEAD/DEAH box helicase [Defluviitoga tunisiensis]HOB55254.1 DEAD/DEAH box helicase [Defluviitoga tunisiensis]HOK16671.1 DEAD/DEAH box helicase [Defluviitoga tunisiensis]
MDKFQNMGLSESTLHAISSKGYNEPTAIQEMVIPFLLSGESNVIGQAQTGTGKTAAFGIPMIEKLKEKAGYVQALVLTPTRELALQVCEELDSLKGNKKLKVISIYGGVSISEQIRNLRKHVDIVVGTPGRIIDHLNRGTLDISNIEYLIIDEADEMLDMGFIEDVEFIISKTNDRKKVLMFSATIPPRIISLAKKYMGKFNIISTIKDSKEDLTVKKARQVYYKIQESDKINLLIRLIDLDDDFYALVFTNTKVQSEEVANRLIENGHEAEVLNGDVSQYQRERILNKFKDKKTKILIATDVAARGIDIDNLKYVINYSLPQNPENYIHRIGRTARAGNEGTAITFVTPREFRKFLFIKNSVGSDIKEAKIPNISDIINSKINRIKDEILASCSENTEKIYKELAQEILEESREDAETTIASVLKYFLKDTLNTRKYEEIRKVERNSTLKNTRLFVALGNNDNISPKKLAEFIEKETGISKKNIRNIQVLEKFSFVSVPFEESQVILETFKRKSKGRKPLVAEAKNQGK